VPDVNGQMMLSDFRAELVARGFDGFTAADLNSMINRGYFYIARKFPWYWRQESASVPYPATGWLSVADVGSSVTGFKNMRAVYLKGVPTASTTVRLEAVDNSDAYDRHLKDLSSGTRAVPSVYFIDQNRLYVLPLLTASSIAAATLELHYNKRPAALTADGQVCVTPVDLDEAVLIAALERCHKRALETNLAASAQIELEEFFDDMRDLEGDREDDLQERVQPDDQWA
jgi:hypothetical protein